MSTAQQGMADKVTIKQVEIEGSLPQKGDSPCDWHVIRNKDGILEAEHYRGRTYKGPAKLFTDAFK